MTSFCKRLVIPSLLLLLFTLSLAGDKTRNHLTTIPWYPSTHAQLNQLVDSFFKQVVIKPVTGDVVGLISPHAGLTYSGQCAANGFAHLKLRTDIERVILLGVSHRGGYYGAAVSDFDFNSTPLGKIPVDTAVTKKLAKEKLFRRDNRIMQNEHSLENLLPFLQSIQNQLNNSKYKIVPILFSRIQQRHFQTIADTIKKYMNQHTLVIASTDFTHYGRNYGYTPFHKDIKNNLTQLDMGMIKPITHMDTNGYFKYKNKTGITMCGFTPVGVLMHLFNDGKHRGTLTDYYKSGDRGNNYSLSVSYASIVISRGKPMSDQTTNNKNNLLQLSTQEKKTLLTMARQTLETHFEPPSNEDKEHAQNISPLLREKAGVFVTLRKNGRLRGCIGTIVGKEPLCNAVRQNVLKAALKDPRFPAVKKKELSKIDLEISVMTPLQQIRDYKKIRLGIDGVILKKGYNQSVFLPQVATETGWGLDRFLSQLSLKAGLSANAYRSMDMEFYIFQALVFEEKELHN